MSKLVADNFCPVIPGSDTNLKHVIMRDIHASALGGHMGVKKMLKFI